MSEKIGRNESCPCGSGKKYKQCCMLKQKQGLDKRKFTAKVISSGGSAYKPQTAQEQRSEVVDYNVLMERSFGQVIYETDEKPPVPENPAIYLETEVKPPPPPES